MIYISPRLFNNSDQLKVHSLTLFYEILRYSGLLSMNIIYYNDAVSY